MDKLIITSSLQMTSIEIATLVESNHGDVKRSIKRLADRQAIQLPPMAKVEDKQSLSPNNKTEAYIFTGEHGKRDSIVVVAQLSPEFTARLVDRWQELETAAANGTLGTKAKRPALPSQLRSKLMSGNAFAKALKISDTSKARMFAAIAESEGIAPTFLPAYVNEPLTKAMTAMLKGLGHPLAAKVKSVVHPALVEMGILERLSRQSSSAPSGVREFYSLTDEGLQYGRNETNPNSPRQTQPLYFVDRFPELLALLENHLEAHPPKPNIQLIGQNRDAGGVA